MVEYIHEKEVEEFFQKVVPSEEVQCLIDFFEEVTNPPYEIRDDTIKAEIEIPGYYNPLELKLTKHERGVSLTIGSDTYRKVYVYAGFYSPMIGSYPEIKEPEEYLHEIMISIDYLFLSNKIHRRIFELVNKLYEKVKDIRLDSESIKKSALDYI